MRTHDVGDLIKLTGTFTDPDNNDSVIDPTAVRLKIEDPSGNVSKIAYDGDDLDLSEDARIWRSAEGVYNYNLDIDEAGVWHYRFYSTGVGQASDVYYFKAEATIGTGT